jgi:bis(5'-nucleosyl)-tetraphosphatase (symmetrical)
MATYVIGDIQGCYKSLQRLLKSVAFDPASDKLWCVGDLINRGPRSLDTLRFLRDIDQSLEIVLGNHDLHFLALHYDCTPEFASNRHTMDDLLNAPDCHELAEWLRHKKLAHYDCVIHSDTPRFYLMVHAGVAPQWSLQKTLNLAAEVELTLRGKHFRDYLKNMYGDAPARWSNKLMGTDRLRVITNYLTRLRFCKADGELDLKIKEAANKAPPGFSPWFKFEQITPAADIVFGHWAALEGITRKAQVHALDTGCVWGRQLTLMRLEDHKRFSV